MTEYACKVIEWLDGDTADVEILFDVLGSRVTLLQRVRVDGINAPEIHSADASEKARGMEAKRYAELLAPVGSTIGVRSANDARPREKYGRWLARVTLADGKDFAAAMIAAGHAVEYHGERR